jgi:lipopolysaccharide export system protein LptA
MSIRRATRWRGVAAAAVLLAAATACGRASRRGDAVPTPQRAAADTATPARVDSSAAAVARAALDSARADSVRADSARARADSAARRRAPSRRASSDPQSRCGTLAFDPVPGNRFQSFSGGPGMPTIAYTGGGVLARCVSIGSTLRADSAEYYQDQGLLYLIGNVVYEEAPRVRLTAQRMTYFQREERLLAEFDVFARMESGTTMTGPSAEYFRAVEGIRPLSRMVAPGRPTITLVGSSRTPTGAGPAAPARPATPDTVVVIANTVVDEGDSVVFASGQVQITRSDIIATSDSATLDNGSEVARLLRSARIDSRGERPFTLSGAVIDLFSRERQLQRVLAVTDARVVSEDLNLKSDTVDLRVSEGKLERVFAWGPSRATATSPDRDIVADSIFVRMPEQRVRMLHAIGRAVARTATDSTRIRSEERDVLAGDSIIAVFDSTAADTTRNPPVRQIVAEGSASSRYQIASRQGVAARPSINYVRGREITVDFVEGAVGTVTVSEQAVGLYLEPRADSTADSLTARRARGDTVPPAGGVRPPTVPPGAPPRRPVAPAGDGPAVRSVPIGRARVPATRGGP